MKEIKKFEKEMHGIQNIVLYAVSTDLKITPGEESKVAIKAEISGFKSDVENYEPRVKMYGDTVEISLSKRSSISIFGISSPKISRAEIHIPRSVSFKVETTSGDIYFDEIDLKNLAVKTVSGDQTIYGGKTESIMINSTSGDIDISGILSPLEDIAIHSVSGDIKLKQLSFSKAYFKTVSGDITAFDVNPKANSIEIKTVSGDASISYSSQPSVHVEFSTVSGDIQTDGERHFSGKISSASFDIGNKPKSVLKFKSVSGDAKFKFGKDKSVRVQAEESDENLNIFRDIMDSKRATSDEVKELMITLGYSQEDIDNFFRREEK